MLRTSFLFCLFLYFFVTSVCAQTGMFLTYECARNTKNARQLTIQNHRVCIAENPLLTTDEIESISTITEYPGMLEFHMVLREKSFERLKQAYSISPFVVYLVDGQVLFTMIPKNDPLTSRRLAVQTDSDFLNFRVLHGLLRDKLNQSD